MRFEFRSPQNRGCQFHHFYLYYFRLLSSDKNGGEIVFDTYKSPTTSTTDFLGHLRVVFFLARLTDSNTIKAHSFD